MNRDDLWYEYYDRGRSTARAKPGMRWNRPMVFTFLGCLVVDVLILWGLISLAERWAR